MFDAFIFMKGALGRHILLAKRGTLYHEQIETYEKLCGRILNAGETIEAAIATVIEDVILFRNHTGNESIQQYIRIPPKDFL